MLTEYQIVSLSRREVQKRTAYASVKLKVIDFAEHSNNFMAANNFTVKQKKVREWRRNKAFQRLVIKLQKQNAFLVAHIGDMALK